MEVTQAAEVVVLVVLVQLFHPMVVPVVLV